MKSESWISQHSKRGIWITLEENIVLWLKSQCYDFSGVGAPVLFSTLIPQSMIQAQRNVESNSKAFIALWITAILLTINLTDFLTGLVLPVYSKVNYPSVVWGIFWIKCIHTYSKDSLCIYTNFLRTCHNNYSYEKEHTKVKTCADSFRMRLLVILFAFSFFSEFSKLYMTFIVRK